MGAVSCVARRHREQPGQRWLAEQAALVPSGAGGGDVVLPVVSQVTALAERGEIFVAHVALVCFIPGPAVREGRSQVRHGQDNCAARERMRGPVQDSAPFAAALSAAKPDACLAETRSQARSSSRCGFLFQKDFGPLARRPSVVPVDSKLAHVFLAGFEKFVGFRFGEEEFAPLGSIVLVGHTEAGFGMVEGFFHEEGAERC